MPYKIIKASNGDAWVEAGGKAMAAPANLPEFKGNVTAVWTDQYWDMQLDELANREWQKAGARIKEETEGKDLGKEEQAAIREQIMNEVFTPEERKILQTGKSNKGYHYLGSSKIMAQIGKAFADKMAELEGVK